MKRLATALAAALLVACGGGEPQPAAPAAVKKLPKPPTVAQAQELIANSPEFSEFEFTNAAVSLPMKTTPVSREAATQLANAGWLTMHGDTIALSEKAKNDKRFIVRPNDVIDVVPLAKKEFGAVQSVRMNGDGTSSADFTWKWIPNEVGQALRDRYAGEQRATATFLWDGTGWRTVLRIRSAGVSPASATRSASP